MLDRIHPPTFYDIDPIQLPLPVQDVSAHDIPLFILNRGNQPIARLEMILYAGQWFEPNTGIAYCTAQMLKRGTFTKDIYAIEKYIDYYGASIGISTKFDYIHFKLTTLTKYIDPMLLLVNELLSTASFPHNAWEIFKNVAKQSIKVNNSKNNYIAKKTLLALLFGQHHPYGRYITPQIIDDIHIDQLKKYYQNQFLQSKAILLSGKIDNKQQKTVKKYLQVLQPQKFFSSIHSSFIQQPPSKKYIAKKQSLQTSIAIGKVLMKSNHPHFLPMKVINTLLGGYFGSRLMKKIREEKGYTYGIFSVIMPFKQTSCILIMTDVFKDIKDKALEAIYQEIVKIQQQPIEKKELTCLKNYMLGVLLSVVNDPFSIMAQFKKIYLHDLSNSYHHALYETIRTINAEMIMDLSKKYLSVDTFSEVMVG